jgi:hypothetical protein
MKIKISSEGFTEKLRYLKRALNNHPGDASQVVAYLNSLSTRLFIDYAKNSNYEFSRILPSRKAYKIVLPYLNKYDELLNKSGSVDIIILDSKTEFEWVEHIQGWTRWGEPTFKSKYPDMPWPCEFGFDILLNDESNAIKDFDLLSEPVPVYSLLEETEEAVKITEKEMAEAA